MPDPARQEKLPTQTVHCCLLQRHCEDLQQKVKHQTVPKKLLPIHQAALPPYPIFVTVPRPRQVMLLINIFAGLPVSPSVVSLNRYRKMYSPVVPSTLASCLIEIQFPSDLITSLRQAYYKCATHAQSTLHRNFATGNLNSPFH